METELAFAVFDRFPVNPGHVLVIPRRHVADLALLSGEELSELFSLVALGTKALSEEYGPEGFNVGMNLVKEGSAQAMVSAGNTGAVMASAFFLLGRIRGIDSGQIAQGDTFHNDRHPDLKADFILANPPFNISDWGGERLRDAFVANGAVQCGFCTPGLMVQASSLIERRPGAGEAEIRRGIEGNLCRCTGYNSIVRAIDAVVKDTYREDRQ